MYEYFRKFRVLPLIMTAGFFRGCMSPLPFFIMDIMRSIALPSSLSLQNDCGGASAPLLVAHNE
jgi:hypothetical protein